MKNQVEIAKALVGNVITFETNLNEPGRVGVYAPAETGTVVAYLPYTEPELKVILVVDVDGDDWHVELGVDRVSF
jgi:spore germination protein YaaH